MRLPGWTKGTALLTMTLTAGFMLGVAYERRSMVPVENARLNSHDAMHHLVRDLDLDSNQQEAIARIFARRQQEVDSTWHSMQPHVRATVDATSREIEDLLRPEQREKFRQMLRERHRDGHKQQ